MRRFTAFLIPTLAVGAMLATGCAEHRYRSYDPYYGSYGYYGSDPYYREWLAECPVHYIEYKRLRRERQREYWEWRRQNEARFRDDPRFRQNNDPRFHDRAVRNDHDADDLRIKDHAPDDRRRHGG